MHTFAIIGSGYRAEYYLRAARAHAEDMKAVGILIRKVEKCAEVSAKWGVPVTVSEDAIDALNPEFIVVAVSKPSMALVSSHWKNKGYVVLCETPAATDIDTLKSIYEERLYGGRLLVAEQYCYYPTYQKILDIIKSGKIGTPVCANISLAHEYHGVSLLRHFLGESASTSYTLDMKHYSLPVTKTHDRYTLFTDGELVQKTRMVATITYEDGKIGFFDFDSEQYHSVIRHNFLKVTGTRGEIINERLWYLDENNQPCEERFTDDIQKAQEDKYDDEEAVFALMMQAGKLHDALEDPNSDESIKVFADWKHNLTNALQDAYMTIQMQNDGTSNSEKMPWHED